MSEVTVEPTEGMTFDDAAAALSSSGEQEAAESAAASPELGAFATPAEQAAATPTPGEETPPVEAAAEFATPDGDTDSFMGGDFNPDLLPDELKPGFQQLNGRWTQRMQEVAEQRKTLEALGTPEELQQAREFYTSLQDPEFLKSFYGELGNVLGELGLNEAPAAAEAVTPPAAPELPPELASIAQSDPELAPFLQEFTSMRDRLDSFETAQAEEKQALQDERQLMVQAAEIDRMVQAVREQHPDYGEDDWQSIYDRAVAFEGNVLEAAERFEADKSRIIEGYLAQKQTPHAVSPTSGGGVVTEDEPAEIHTLDDAQAAAEAYINANDLQEFGG